jgi:signal transduction histidine kinase
VTALLALAIVALGALALIRWVFGIAAFVRPHPLSTPMAYATALAFIASGGALLLLDSGHRRSASMLAVSAVGLVLASMAWPEPGLNEAIHAWLSERLFVHPATPVGGITWLGASSVSLYAVAVLLLALARTLWARLTARLIGVALAAIGIMAVFGALAGDSHGLAEPAFLANVAVQTGFGLAGLGAGLVALSTRQLTAVDLGGPRWLPAMVGLVSLVMTLGFWQLSEREVQRLARPSAMAQDSASSRLPLVALGLGLALTIVLMGAVNAAQRARRRSLLFEDANRRLVEEAAERQRAQQELAALADDLRRSNRELEDFAAIASHDLRSPLTKLRGFADILREDYAAAIDTEGRAILERLVAIVSRMQTLVDDLLTLARVRARGRPFERVDLGEVARTVVADLETAIAASSARVDIGTLPTIDADPTQMRQLLQNLVANSLKFVRRGVAPLVRIDSPAEAGADDREVEVRVTDNGIGFEPRFADQIFRPFERLHAAQEYDGSGIGLPVCARIVSRHGGSIRAEGRPGEGATFIVRLPRVREGQHTEPQPHTPAAAGA